MLEIKNLFLYHGKKTILENINIRIAQNRFTAIIGINGSGKSSLVSCINQTVQYSGDIFLEEKNLKDIPRNEKAKMISVLPQILPKIPFTVEETVSLGREPHGDKNKKAIEKALADTETILFRHKKMTNLSGGERQRAFLALILAQDARLAVFDEPTTFMDISASTDFFERLCKMKNEGKTILTVMHDLSSAVRFADDIIILNEGKVVFCGNTQSCLECNAIEKNFKVKVYKAENRVFFSK